MYDQAAKERQKVRKGNQAGTSPEKIPDLNGADSRDAAGKAVGVNGKYVDHATKVLTKAIPEAAGRREVNPGGRTGAGKVSARR